MTVINKENAKLIVNQKKRKARKTEVPVDSASDSDNSVAMIEQINTANKKKKLEKFKLKQIAKDHEKSPEEIAFLKKTHAMESDSSSNED